MNPLSIISFLLLAATSFGIRHRHLGPIGNESCFLYGKISSTAFKAELKKDVIIWDELARYGTFITSCQSKSNGTVFITIAGPKLDTSDYRESTAFVIDLDDWEDPCGNPEKVLGVSPLDPVLFFNIVRSKDRSEGTPRVSMRLERVPGSTVSPFVEVTQLPRSHPAVRQFKEFHVSTEDFLNPKSTQVTNSVIPFIDDTIPSEDADVSEFSIFPGARVETRATFDASVGSLRFTRFFNLEVEWQQAVRLNVSALFTSSSQYQASNRREILRKDVPNFSFRTRIPFLGTITANAYKKMSLVQRVSVDENLVAFVQSTYENMLRISAKFSSRALSIESLLPPGFGSSGTGVVDFGEVVRHEFGMDGFFGYEVAVGVILRLGRRSIDAMADVTIGQESSINLRLPPFPPLTVDGNGVCATCHRLRLQSGIVGKDLRTRVFENGRIVGENVHIRDLFRYNLSSICADAASC